MVKLSTHQEDLTIINVCAPNNKATKYIWKKLTELKEETEFF